MERTNFDPRALDAQHYLLLDPARVEEEGAQSWEKLPLHVLAPSGFEAHARHLAPKNKPGRHRQSTGLRQ